MIVQLQDSVAGTAVYINPEYVVALRPDPVEPTRVTTLKLSDGELIRVVGDHEQIADRLARAA